LIDFVIVAIVALCVWRGYRNGLIRGVFGVVSLIAALLIANAAAKAYSDEFVGMLRPFVGGIVDTTLADIAEEDADNKNDSRESDAKDYTTAYSVLRRIGLPKVSAARIAAMVSHDDDSDVTLAEMTTDKLSSVLAFVAVFGIGFVLVAIVFAVIGNLISFVFSLPGLKLLDRASGVVFGLVKGLLIVFTLAAIVRYFGLLAQSTVEETRVLNYIVNNNMIANSLGL
jgi:uncharacterized membrane protein required for colicin V production